MALTRAQVFAWAALSGLLWALAWPAVGGFSLVAFVAWLPLLKAERLHALRTAGRPRSFFPYVWLATLIWNGLGAWWFYNVSEPLETRLVSGTAPLIVNSLLMTLPWVLKRFTLKHLGFRAANSAFIAFWLAFEHLHHNWDLQWPWFSIGNVFGFNPQWIQWYEVTGMLGGSLWVLLVALFLDRIVISIERGEEWIKLWKRTITPVLLIILPLAFSIFRFHSYKVKGDTAEVIIVQPNIDPYNEKFGGVNALVQLDNMLALAEPLITDSTQLIILPETALQENASINGSSGIPVYTGLWENDLHASESVQRIKTFQKEHPNVAVLAGMNSDSLYQTNNNLPIAARPVYRDIPEDRSADQRWYVSYNAALWMPAKGPVRSYHKSKLVAGVEQLPFEKYLGPISATVVDLGGTTGSLGKQKERSVLEDENSALRVVPAICYEGEFGEHIALHVQNGGNLIAIITNDGWWGDSPGYKQHITFATIRAIETRRDVARSANTGISCFSDQRGVIRDRTEWWLPDAKRSTVHLNNELTFFARYGNMIGVGALYLSMIILITLIAVVLTRRYH